MIIDSPIISGSLTVSGSTTIVGSMNIASGGTLQGTASYATTASYALNAGTTVSTASLLTTASVSSNTITFTKGDGTTFPITVATGSGSGGGSTFPYSGSAIITGSLEMRMNLVDSVKFTPTASNHNPTYISTVNNAIWLTNNIYRSSSGAWLYNRTNGGGTAIVLGNGGLEVYGTTGTLVSGTVATPYGLFRATTNGISMPNLGYNETSNLVSFDPGTGYLYYRNIPTAFPYSGTASIVGKAEITGALEVLNNASTNVAHFEGVNGSPLQILTADESLSVGYAATQGSIGVGQNRLQIKYANDDDTQWADAAYNLYVGNIDLNSTYYITYPGTYEVTVGSATGGNAIYLPAFNAWSYGAKVTIINATDEYVSVNTQLSENRYLEGTTNNISAISPRSINEYVSTGTDWRILPSMKQLTYDDIDLSSGDFYIYTKGVYKFTQGSGDNLYFPNPGNFEGETLIISNQSANSINVYDNGYRPHYMNDSQMGTLDAYSVHQFVAIGGYWRIVSLAIA